MRFQPSILALILALVAPAAPCAPAAPLKLCFEDVPQGPWTMPDGSGLNFELLQRAAKLTGDKLVFLSRPWRRCQEETRMGQMDGMFGAADAPDRRDYSLPPLLPDGTPNMDKALYQDRVDVFMRADSGAQWDGKTLLNPRGIVIAQRGYFLVELLQRRGHLVQDTAKSAEDGLRMLVAGTADVAMLLAQAGGELVRNDPRFQGRIVIARQPYIELPFYLVFNRQTYAREPKRIEAFWSAIASVRASAEYRKLEAAETQRLDKPLMDAPP